MPDISELYFVARTDVGGDMGLQRVFGAWDTEDEASRKPSGMDRKESTACLVGRIDP